MSKSIQLKIDPHVHSTYSDGNLTPIEILEQAKIKGLDGFSITDHCSLKGYLKAKAYKMELLIIPGYEVETEAGHILVLGLEKLPSRVKEIEYVSLIEWVKEQGGITILAHPAINRLHLKKWRRHSPDAIEVLNAAYPLKYFIGRGLRISERLGVPAVGGSDSHIPFTIGDAYTVVETQNPSIPDILNSIKSGSVRFEGDLSSIGSRLHIGLRHIKHMLI